MPMQSSLNWQDAFSSDRANRVIGVAALFLFALAALLFWRRMVGAIHEPLSTPCFVAAGLFLGFFAIAVRSVGWYFYAKDREKAALLSDTALSLALLAVAATLTLPGTSTAGICVFWSILLVEEGFAWRTRLIRETDRQEPESTGNHARIRESEAPTEPQESRDNPAVSTARREPRPPDIASRSSGLIKSNSDTDETILPQDVTQQLTRSTAADGTEELAGWLRVPFAIGQRTGSVHLAFCPPFAHTPELSVEQIDGPAARIKTAQVLPYGARLDLKLHALGESPANVVLQFVAHLESGK